MILNLLLALPVLCACLFAAYVGATLLWEFTLAVIGMIVEAFGPSGPPNRYANR